MLAPDYLDHAPDRLVLLWQQVEDDILRDVARRISKMDTMTPTANWQLWRYEQTEALRQDVVKKLARYTGKSEAEIRRLMQEAATRAMEAEDEIYYHYGKETTPFADNAPLQALLNAGYQQTAGTFHNLTATTANTVSGQFEAALDRAHLKVNSGAFDYKSAVKSAVDSLADTMKYVTYPTGHTDTLEVAARRAVLTGVNQTGAKLQVARADEMGVEFFETTAHGGARPSHAEWQGRLFHRGGAVVYMGKFYPDFEAATGYGTGAGLCGWNCRHTFFAIFPELGAPPAWTQADLEALNARDIEYNGGKYTRYEISQMQRARERTVRKYKRRYLAEDAAGADTTASAVKLRQARQELSDFISAPGGRAINYWWGLKSGAERVEYPTRLNDGTLQLLKMAERQLCDGEIQVFPTESYTQGHALHHAASGIYTPKELMEMDWLEECVEGELPSYDELDAKTRSLLNINGLDNVKGTPQ